MKPTPKPRSAKIKARVMYATIDGNSVHEFKKGAHQHPVSVLSRSPAALEAMVKAGTRALSQALSIRSCDQSKDTRNELRRWTRAVLASAGLLEGTL